MNDNAATRVAFLGLGTMGAGMAGSLARAGFALAVYNRNPERAQAFAGRARIAASPLDAVRDADVVVSMVADDAAAHAVWLGEQGALSALRPGTLCIESSTLTPAWVRRWAAAVAERGGAPLDAPVTGSRAQAEAGELSFMAGGAPDLLERAQPVLAAMGRKIVPLGPVGSGATFKLINNFLCGAQLAALAEAMAWIDRSGLDRQQAFDTLAEGAPGSPLVKNVGGRMLRGDDALHFHLALMRKDLAYAASDAQASGVALTTAIAAEALIARAVAAGHGEDDIAGLYRYVGEDAP
jgi:3-hydroxyisobutyrate dehydrogenase